MSIKNQPSPEQVARARYLKWLKWFNSPLNAIVTALFFGVLLFGAFSISLLPQHEENTRERFFTIIFYDMGNSESLIQVQSDRLSTSIPVYVVVDSESYPLISELEFSSSDPATLSIVVAQVDFPLLGDVHIDLDGDVTTSECKVLFEGIAILESESQLQRTISCVLKN